MLKTVSSPFGGNTRTRVLIALQLLKTSYPRELSRVLEAPVSGVRKALRGLEFDAMVAARSIGRTRVYQINPVYFAARELTQYVQKLADADARLRDRTAQLRRRPRRSGKPL